MCLRGGNMIYFFKSSGACVEQSTRVTGCMYIYTNTQGRAYLAHT